MSSYTKEELEYYKEKVNKNPRIKYWKTLDGDIIPFEDLKLDHLKNILRHLNTRIAKATNDDMRFYLQNNHTRLEKELLKRLTITPVGKILYGKI